MRTPAVRLVSRTDLFEVMAIAVLTPIAWLAPERAWMAVSKALSLAIAWGRPGITGERVATLARALGARRVTGTLSALRVAIMAGYMEERLQILRDHRPGGWHPRIRTVGGAHLDGALAAGRGAVLWIAPFAYADLVAKIALHASGIPLSHLSAYSRGFSPNSCYSWLPTRFGMKVLSPLRTAVENRYLRERIALTPDGSLAYARRVETVLRANGVVSIRAGETGHRTLALPFLEGQLRLATGAPSMALATGATLLPVFPVRTGPGSFDVIIEAPLASDPAAGRRDRIADLMRCYATLLERYVLSHPSLWSGWYAMDLAPAADTAADGAIREPAFESR